MADSERRHSHEAAYLEFMERQTSLDYIVASAEWIKREYPGSIETIFPKLRKIYKRVAGAK